MPEMNKEEQVLFGLIILVITIVALAIRISVALFPVFLILLVVSFLAFIISALIEFFFRDHSYSDIWDYVSTYIGIGVLVFLAGTGVTYGIGFGIGGTSFGQACILVYDGLNIVSEVPYQALEMTVEAECNTLSQNDCNTLHGMVKTARTVQDVSDMADSLRKGSNLVKNISQI